MPATAALYVRVSTADQTAENQLEELQRLAAARGYIAVIYSETESAAKRRPVFEAMIADVKAGRVSAILVWALDRLHRSMTGALTTILECDRLGVPVISLRESWLDTTGPVRPLLIAIFGWVAEQERSRLIERTKAGLERARRQGKTLGRPRHSPVMLYAAAEKVAAGMAVAEAARCSGVKRSTLRRFMAERRTALPSKASEG
ncbi:MAG: recombinase family protein [Anaeromyxobacter sp.]|nr:recombinase family protein [Anaeromyxobacter sp.]